MKKSVFAPGCIMVSTSGLAGSVVLHNLQSRNFRVVPEAANVIGDIVSRPAQRRYQASIVLGQAMPDSDRTIAEAVRIASSRMIVVRPSTEVAAALRLALGHAELDQLGITTLVVLHEPCRKSAGARPVVLSLTRLDGKDYLNAVDARPDRPWGRTVGFAAIELLA